MKKLLMLLILLGVLSSCAYNGGYRNPRNSMRFEALCMQQQESELTISVHK